MRKFKYLVAYSYKKYNDFGLGTTYMISNKKITNFKRLDEIRERLEKELKCREVCILNFKLL